MEKEKENWFQDKTIKPRKLDFDVKKYLDQIVYKPGLPGPLVKFSKFLEAIIHSAIITECGYTYETPLQCRKKPGRKQCPGKILIYMETEESDILWKCPICGDGGNIVGDKTNRELGNKIEKPTLRDLKIDWKMENKVIQHNSKEETLH